MPSDLAERRDAGAAQRRGEEPGRPSDAGLGWMPAQPGIAAAGRPRWAGRDEAEAGPPGRGRPGSAGFLTYQPMPAGKVIFRPRTCEFRPGKARIDIFRPGNANSGQKLYKPARGVPGHKYVSQDPPTPARGNRVPTRGRICRTGNVEVDPGQPYAGLGESMSARDVEEDLRCSEVVLMSSPRADEEDPVRMYSYQRLDQPHGGHQMSSW
jgi:hypothetical protein